MKNLISIFNLFPSLVLFLMRLFLSLRTDTQSRHQHSEQGMNRFSSLRQHILASSFQAISPILFIVLLLPLNLYAFKMESDSVTLHNTSSNPTFTTVTFRQTYDTIPIVVATATANGGEPCSVRIRNITVNGFHISQVEPANQDGMHASMTIDYVAIEPGVHMLADGTKIEAGTRSTTTLQHGSGVLGTEGWNTITFAQTFSTTPTVLALIQGMANESNNPPAEVSSPWLVTAIRSVNSGSMQLALERAEVNTGSVTSNETIGYIAIESNRQGTIGSIDYETRITADSIRGWDNGCYSTSFNNAYSSAPKVIATQNRHDGGDGGWVRICSKNNSGVGLTIDEDDYRDSERSHTTEAAGMVVFSGAFDLDASSNIYSCPGVVIPNLDGTAVSATDSFSSVTVPPYTTYYYYFTPTVAGTIQTNSYANKSSNSLYIKDGCGTNLWSNTVNSTNKSSPAIAVAANQQIVIAFERRYNTSLTLNIDFTFTAMIPEPPTMADIPDQTAIVGTPFTLNISSYVTEPDGDTIAYSATGLPPGLTIDTATGIISGTPTVAGTFNVTATATDPDGSASDPFDIVVSNPPLIAVDDSYNTSPGTSINDNLLINDSGLGIALTANTDPAQGTLTISPDGNFTYTPGSSASGTDTFTYTITDNFGSTATATVTITIETDYGGLAPFELINPNYTRNIRGNYKIAGNTVMCLTEKTSGYGGTCHGMTDYSLITSNMRVSKYIDIDGTTGEGAGTWNSSSSYIELPDTYDQRGGYGILWAGLFWQGRFSNDTGYHMHYGMENGSSYNLVEMGRDSGYGTINISTLEANKIKFKVDSASYNGVSASTVHTYSSSGGVTYAAFSDVTSILQASNLDKGKHNFTVANLTTNEGREGSPGVFGGWSLVVIYAEDFNGQPRNISVYSGFDIVANPSDTFTISGFKLPAAGDVHSTLSLFSGEGEYLYGKHSTSSTYDWIKISDDDATYSLPNSTMTHPENVFDGILDGITREDVAGHYNNLQVNNDGVDIDNFDVSDLITSYRNNDANMSTLYIKWSSNNDYITPSMMIFATELYVPRLCYDYTLDIDGYVLDSEDNEIITPFGGYGVPLRTHLFVRSLEGDIDFVDVNISYSIDDTSQLHYSTGSTEISEDGSYSYIDASLWTHDETISGFNMYIGTGKTDTSGGIIAAEESRYIKLDSDFASSTVDTHFNFDIHYNVDYGSGAVPMHKRFNVDDLCAGGGAFDVTYGLFNVVDGDASNTDPKYNLFTQVAGRPFNLKVFAHDPADPYALSSTDLNLSVEVEFIRADDFIRSIDITCQDEHAVLDRNMTLAKDRAKFVHLDGKHATISYDANDLDFAYRSLAMRVWYLANGDGSLIDDHDCTRANQAGCETLYQSAFASIHQCDAECLSGGSGCYDCLRTYYGRKVCSRDNFSVRPEAFLTNLIDSDQSADINHTSTSIMVSKASETNSGNLVAGYEYRFDINATSQASDDAVPKYIQDFTDRSSGHLAQMLWNGPSALNCNDVADKNISVNMFNGSTVNYHAGTSLVDDVDQIGDYRFMIVDQNWTSVDWSDTEMLHHTTGIKSAYFIQGDDCVYGSNGTSARPGCTISSAHTTPAGEVYTTLDVQYYPYTFNVNGLTIGAGPTNDKGFVYINTLDPALYPNGIDENMSYNIQGTFFAGGYNNADVSNFVNQCYAEDVDMTLNHTYLSDIPANTANLTYDLIDYNTSNPSTIIRVREQNTFTDSLARNVETPLLIQQNPVHFEKSMKGAITMDLGFNFTRENNATLNPRRINFSDFNVSYTSSPNINVDMKNDYKIFGDTIIDANITFLYARAKPGKEFYEDVTTASINTPISVVAYCDLGYKECADRGILSLLAQTNETNWWKSWDHNNQLTQDGNIQFGIAAITEGAGSSPSLSANRANISVQAEDATISTARGTDPVLPLTVPVNLITDPTQPNYTNRWLIHNPDDPILPPIPFFRVRFIGNSTWSGVGSTGNVVGNNAASRKTKRLDW